MARFRYFLNIFMLLTIVGCTTAIPSATPATTPDVVQPGATVYPYPEPVLETSLPGYPPPVEEPRAPTPTTDSTLGIVQGELYLKGEPVKEIGLFLSDIYKDKQGNDSVVSIDYNTSNRALTEQDGSFMFVNIPPKRYALVLVVMPNTYVLLDPRTQEPMIVDVKAGETIKLGNLDYDDLPILE